MHSSTVLSDDIAELLAIADETLQALHGKRVLVTGGAGFLMSYLVEALVRLGGGGSPSACHVYVADNFQTGVASRLEHLRASPNMSLLQVDVSRPLDLPSGLDVDVVIHGASIASPIVYRKHPLETAEVNALGTYYLLKKFAEQPLAAFVVISTSEVYGDPEPSAIPTPETYRGSVSCTGPRACYDESKRFAETLAVIFHQTLGLPTIVIRPFNVYGPGLRLDDGRVLPDMVRNVLLDRDIELFSDGTPTRSFCYIKDFMIGLLLLIAHGKRGEAYNVGSDEGETSIRDLAQLVLAVTGSRRTIRFQTSADKDYTTDNPQRRCPDLSKLRGLGEFSPSVPLREGLRRYVAWARESGELDRIRRLPA